MSKYKTIEEKKEANKQNARNWYQKHKNDPKFIEKRKKYLARYYSNIDSIKKDFYKTYHANYSFYVRNIRTGKLEKKIIKSKEELKRLENSIFDMENKLAHLKKVFGHLENKNVK